MIRPLLKHWFLGLFLFEWLWASDLDRFKSEILDKRQEILQFQILKQKAEDLGLRVFLVGGLAASFSRYVSLDLKRRGGFQTYAENRFKYDWDQIFYPTQDIDLAITKADGSMESPSDIQKYKEVVASIFGAQTKIDIFGLQLSQGIIPALENLDSDFHKQNTDSLSNGMIELTANNLIKDLRFNDDRFFSDIENETISLHLDQRHAETDRARQGINPDFLAVLRFLINAGRYGLKIKEEDLSLAKKTVSEFDTNNLPDYVQSWILKNGKKLIEQSFDLERSFQLIEDETKLKEKLLTLPDKEGKGGLHWLLTRHPLKSLPARNAPSKKATAASLGIDIITHETSDYKAFRQILSNPYGAPNVFSSINGDGQTALYGEGFYAKKGNWGGAGGGFHIQMKLAPDAQRGIDFDLKGGHILIYNRAKLKIIYPPLKDKILYLSSLLRQLNQNEMKSVPAFLAALKTFSINYNSSRILVLEETKRLIQEKKVPELEFWLQLFSADPSIGQLELQLRGALKSMALHPYYSKKIKRLNFKKFTIEGIIYYFTMCYVGGPMVVSIIFYFLFKNLYPLPCQYSCGLAIAWFISTWLGCFRPVHNYILNLMTPLRLLALKQHNLDIAIQTFKELLKVKFQINPQLFNPLNAEEARVHQDCLRDIQSLRKKKKK